MFDWRKNLDEHIAVAQSLYSLESEVLKIAQRLFQCVENGGTIFWMGNGGSAADAQHLAAELIGRFKAERPAISSTALTTDSSILTCLTNDYDYSIVFSRQLEAMCGEKDAVIGITTSGQSPNVLKGIETARKRGAYTLGLTGEKGQKLADLCDDCLLVPSVDTARIQEAHILLGHSLCEYIEATLCEHSATNTSGLSYVG